MKLILTVLGLVLIVVAVVYFVMPADQLPSFMPGHEAGVARVPMKHGIVSGVAGVILLAAGWFMGRRSAPRGAGKTEFQISRLGARASGEGWATSLSCQIDGRQAPTHQASGAVANMPTAVMAEIQKPACGSMGGNSVAA